MRSLAELIAEEVERLGSRYGFKPSTTMTHDHVEIRVSGEEIAKALRSAIHEQWRGMVEVSAGDIVIRVKLR